MGWDILVLVLVVWLAIYLPLIIAFPNLQIKPLDITIVVIFMLDIVITLRTTFFDREGDEIIDQQLIAFNYIMTYQFYLDVLSAIPITEIYQGDN